MPFSTTYANNILNYLFAKVSSLTPPSEIYLGFCSNDPEEDGGTITELSGGGYSRVLIAQKGETYPNVIGSASNRAITNTYQINLTKATSDWVEAKGFFFSSSPTVGETSSIFYYAKLDEPYPTCESGAVMLFDPGTLQISFPTTDVSAAATTAE